MRQSLADATGLSERRDGIVRVSVAASFPWASWCRIHAQSCSELVCLPGCFRDRIAWGKGKAFAAGIFSRKSPGFEVESQAYLTAMGYDGSFLQFRNPGKRRTRLQSMLAGSPPKGIASSLRVLSCCSKVKLSMRQKIWIFAERCREDGGRRGNCIGGPERSEGDLSVDIEI
jgi:hypothetical protein